MPRGGPRPGAGAKRGNLNALKHGRRSAQVQALLPLLSTIPETRDTLIRLSRRQAAQRRQAERTAALLLYNLLDQALRGLTNNRTDDAPSDSDRILDAILPAKRSNTEPDSPAPSKHDT